MLKRMLRYFFRSRLRLNHGGRLISVYTFASATEDEKLLMLAGVARSPEDARFLMAKFNTTRASEVLKRVKRLKRSATPGERLVTLVRHIEGHNPRDVYGKPHEEPDRIERRFRYRRPEW